MLRFLFGSLDLSVFYCPRCDVALMFLGPVLEATPPTVLQWHRLEGRLALRDEDRGRWGEVPHQTREHLESKLHQSVDGFLRHRHSERAHCPLDGMPNPVIHRWQDQAGVGWLMTWCASCAKAFVFAFDPDYGWEHCADLAWNAGHRTYELTRTYPTGARRTVDPATFSTAS